MSYTLTFSGFRDGDLEDCSDGKTIHRLYNGGHFASWRTETNKVEVCSVLVQHDTQAVTAELLINQDFDLLVEVSIRTLLDIAPPELVTFLVENLPNLQAAERES